MIEKSATTGVYRHTQRVMLAILRIITKASVEASQFAKRQESKRYLRLNVEYISRASESV